MDIPLESPIPSLTMLPNQTSDQETKFTIICHDEIFERVTTADEHGKPLFRVSGGPWGSSWSWRRKVWDVRAAALENNNNNNNKCLFDLRHYKISLKNGWIVETPEGQEICSLVHKAFFTKEHSAINATMRTEAGEQVLVCMRPVAGAGCASKVTVNIGETTIAVISKVSSDTEASFGVGRHGSVWEARVAAGVDQSFVRNPPPFFSFPRSSPI